MATLASLGVLLRLDASEFRAGIEKAQKTLRTTGRELESIGKSLSTNLSAPMVVAGGAAVKLATDFGSSMTKVQTLVGESQEQVAQWRDDLLRMAPQVGKMPRELADALVFVTSAGIKGSAALDTVRAAAEASAIGLGQTATVADAVTSAVNVYTPAVLSAGEATAILYQAVKEGKAAGDEFAPVVGRVADLAAELHVPFNDVAAALAHMTRTTGDAGAAGTQLRGVFSKLIKPTQQAREALFGAGTSIEQLRSEVAEKGLLKTLVDLRSRFGDNADALAVLVEDVEALNGVLSLTRDQGAGAERIFRSLADVTVNDLKTAFEETGGDPGQKFKEVMAGIAAASVRLGDVILPVVVPAAQKLSQVVQGLVERYEQLSTPAQNVVKAIAAVGVAAGPVIVAAGILAGAIAAIGTTATTVGVAVAAATALIGANWEQIKSTVQKGVEAIRPALLELRVFMLDVFGKIRDFATEVWPTIQELAEKAATRIRAFWERDGEAIMSAVTKVWGFVQTFVGNAVDVTLGAVQAALQVLNADWLGARQTMLEVALAVQDGMGRYFKAGALLAMAAFHDLNATAGRVMEDIILYVRSTLEAWRELPLVGIQVEGSINNVAEVFNRVHEAVANSRTRADEFRSAAEETLKPLQANADKLTEFRSAWQEVPVDAGSAGRAIEGVIEATTKTGEAIQTQLSGGFGRGFDDGVESAKRSYRNLQEWMNSNPLRPTVDGDAFMRFLRELGMEPDTSGSLP